MVSNPSPSNQLNHGTMKQYFHPTASHVNLQGAAQTSLPACLPFGDASPASLFLRLELSPQTVYPKPLKSSGFFNAPSYDAILNNVAGRQEPESCAGRQTKGVWMIVLLTQRRK